MTFLEQGNKAEGPKGVYIITLCLVVLGFFIGLIISQMIAVKIGGIELGGRADGGYKNLTLALQLFPFLVSFVAVLASVKYLHKQPVLSVFTSRERFDWKRFFTSFTIWGGVLALFMVIGIVLGSPIEFRFSANSFFPLLLVSLILIPIQTTAEDLVFRGVFFQGLGGSMKSGTMAILILGGVFGWLHSGNPEVQILGRGILIYYIVTGIFFGLLTHLDDGMELGMGYHMVNNLFGALILTNDWQAFQTDALFVNHSVPSFNWEFILTLVAIQPVLIFIFFKIYKWKGVKEKLLN